MSTGGIFTLITNDGRQDRVLMANDLLQQRLSTISQERERQGMDPTPTLLDIEKTHVLFMNAHFKPFAAIGFEYNKVRNSAGTVTLGTTVQFSIPQFGDFFHDMVLHVKLGAVSATGAHTWRWVSWPGERLVSRTKFLVNGNILDEYVSQDYAFYRQFSLKADKLVGYQRCMGQQVLIPAQVVPEAGTALNAAATGSIGAAAAAVDESTNFWVNVSDGYQTVKNHTAAATTTTNTGHVRTDILEVTVPLMFWFNQNPQLAIPSVSIPFGQRYLEFDLAPLSDLAAGVSVNGADGTTNSVAGTLSISGTQVQTCDLYVNNIFVNPEVHTIFIRRVGFNLIRVHRRQLNRISTLTGGDIHLNSLKWPIETIFFGFRDAARNGDSTAYVSLDNWHSFGQAHSIVNGMLFCGVAGSELNVQYNKLLPVVQTVSFSAHGIPLYNDTPAVLLNQYIPWAYGNGINTPTDPGVYCVTFNLYPGIYQPSGHINVSRAREFYVKFDNTVVAGRNLGTSPSAVDFMATARALNFLLISDGSAVLRYST
jgi:hypothetical protein